MEGLVPFVDVAKMTLQDRPYVSIATSVVMTKWHLTELPQQILLMVGQRCSFLKLLPDTPPNDL
jgi:hypothetical protein